MSAQQMGMDGSDVPAESIPSGLTDDDRSLDAITKLWAEAEALEATVEMYEDEARNARYSAEDKLDEASDLIRDVVAIHPEWKATLEDGHDPRVRSWD